jgi:hypothetical protein
MGRGLDTGGLERFAAVAASQRLLETAQAPAVHTDLQTAALAACR